MHFAVSIFGLIHCMFDVSEELVALEPLAEWSLRIGLRRNEGKGKAEDID
jgi:hypothetical protein